MKSLKIGIATVAVAAASILGLGACTGGDEVGKTNTDEYVTEGPAETPTEEETSDTGLDDGRSDVTLKSCTIKDPYDMGDKYAVADLKIKNSSKKVSDYLIEIEVSRPNGDRVDTILASASNVAPRQGVDTGNGDGEEDGSTFEDVTGPFRCSIMSADRAASTE